MNLHIIFLIIINIFDFYQKPGERFPKRLIDEIGKKLIGKNFLMVKNKEFKDNKIATI